MPPLPDDERCWQAVCERDAGFDQRFVFSVRSTGVYCRPSCPARRPSRANVRFHADAAAAEAAGRLTPADQKFLKLLEPAPTGAAEGVS